MSTLQDVHAEVSDRKYNLLLPSDTRMQSKGASLPCAYLEPFRYRKTNSATIKLPKQQNNDQKIIIFIIIITKVISLHRKK